MKTLSRFPYNWAFHDNDVIEGSLIRSQISDHMDKWKSRGGKSQRGEEPKREDQRRERVRRKKMQAREKVGKLRNTMFLICGSGRSKSRLAKAAGAEPSGQMRDEKLRRCGAKHMSKSKCTKHTSSGPLLEVEVSKKFTLLWCEAHFEAVDCAPWQK